MKKRKKKHDAYDINAFMRILKMSSTYEEFCVNCDMHLARRMIADENEFNCMKLIYAPLLDKK